MNNLLSSGLPQDYVDGILQSFFKREVPDPWPGPSLLFPSPGNTKHGKNSGNVVNVVAATSRDGGATWTERRVTDRGFNPDLEVFDRGTFLGDYISAVPAGRDVLVAWTDLRDVVKGKDRRERGSHDDHDGFDVLLPCHWQPLDIEAKTYRIYANDPCLAKGGLDENVYLAKLS